MVITNDFTCTSGLLEIDPPEHVTVCVASCPRRGGLTVYALTDRHAIVFGCGDSVGTVKMQVQSYGRDMLDAFEARERADGSGDLILEPLPKMRGTVVVWTPRHGFMAIENVRQVEALVRDTLQSASTGPRQWCRIGSARRVHLSETRGGPGR